MLTFPRFHETYLVNRQVNSLPILNKRVRNFYVKNIRINVADWGKGDSSLYLRN